jgi:hypothetical protein
MKREQSRPQKHHQDNAQEEKGKDQAANSFQAGREKQGLYSSGSLHELHIKPIDIIDCMC